MATQPPLLVIAGATATGKTELAIRLAESVMAGGRPAAIISADSRQVYRGLDIGTAKVGAADRARVPHHGLDLVEPDQPFSAGDFAEHARSVLTEVRDRDGVALLVGGSGLYLRAVARGLDTAALPHDATVRARLERELHDEGLVVLVERLRRTGPTAAARVDLANPRRVVRALEIVELAGDGERPPPKGYPGPVGWIGLTVDAPTHRRWIADRARGQFDAGLLDEAEGLRGRFDPTLPAFSAIGYREAWAVLDGDLSLAAAVELDVQRNVRFAKRQRTWFRAEPDVTWLDAAAGTAEAQALVLLERLLER